MKITTFEQFEKFIISRIPKRADLFMGDIGIKRAKHFMKLLGNPQNKIKVVHIAGTSGKGSTAYLASHLLQSQGFSVGLSVSPHILDIRERMQINNRLPGKKLILRYLNEILPAIEKMGSSRYGLPTYFEINVGLAFYMFAKEKLDYAVIETGLGGRLDATNTVTQRNKIAILTRIGLDHTEILGKTIKKIATDKADIIQNKNITISIKQPAAAQAVIKKKCIRQQSPLYIIKKGQNYSTASSTPQETMFDFAFGKSTLKNIRLSLIGKHQAENCSLALACLILICQREKITLNEKKLRATLEKISIPGRFEIKKVKKNTVVIDGAHNKQKMDAFIESLGAIYPKQKFTFILAFKKGKDYAPMLKKIIPLADKIFLARFSTENTDGQWSSVDNKILAKFLKTQRFNDFKIISNKKSEISKTIEKSKKPVVITGSLYLIGSIYPFLEK